MLCWFLWLYRGITKQASVIKIIVFWNVTSCRLLDISENYNYKSYQCENVKYQSFVCVCVCAYIYLKKVE